MIELHSFCYRFQRRLFWQMSSLAQQIKYIDKEVPAFHLTIIASERDPNKNWYDIIDKAFRYKFSYSVDYLPDDIFRRRTFARTHGLTNAKGEWLIYVDCDMVYSPEFFAQLADILETQPADEHRLFATGRASLLATAADTFVNNADYTQPISNVFETVQKGEIRLPIRWNRIVGAGYFQAVRPAAVKKYFEEKGYNFTYSDRSTGDSDIFLAAGVEAVGKPTHGPSLIGGRCDKHFRGKCGGIVPLINLRSIHLGHERIPLKEGECQ